MVLRDNQVMGCTVSIFSLFAWLQPFLVSLELKWHAFLWMLLKVSNSKIAHSHSEGVSGLQLQELTRLRHAPFHTCYLYLIHLWPESHVNWGLTFRKHRKYDINTSRLWPREARDLSLAHFPASIYPEKAFPSRLQEVLPYAASSSSTPPLPPCCVCHKIKEIAPGRSSVLVSCAIESGSANSHHGGHRPLLFHSTRIPLKADVNVQTDWKLSLLAWSKFQRKLDMTIERNVNTTLE